MDRHNYNAFKERMNQGRALQQAGDRNSYTSHLEGYKNRFAANRMEEILNWVLLESWQLPWLQ